MAERRGNEEREEVGIMRSWVALTAGIFLALQLSATAADKDSRAILPAEDRARLKALGYSD